MLPLLAHGWVGFAVHPRSFFRLNSGDKDLIDLVLALQEDDSPLVRGAAIWALARLDPSRFE
ncbi:MAG: HEAT repeat domain-containing protein, partial [Pseudomonadota bacterium]